MLYSKEYGFFCPLTSAVTTNTKISILPNLKEAFPINMRLLKSMLHLPGFYLAESI